MAKEQGSIAIVNLNFHGYEQKNNGHDFVVVGGGPAGLKAATVAANGGLDTVLIEQQPKIGSHIKTSFGLFDRDNLGIPKEICHQIKQLRLVSPNNASTSALDPEALVIVDRNEYFPYSEEEVRKAGAKIMLKTHASGIIYRNGYVHGVKVRTSDGKEKVIESNLTTDASGQKATLAKDAGLIEKQDSESIGVGAEWEMIAPYYDQDTITIVLHNDLIPGGYGWVFPWGEKRIKIGVDIFRPNSSAKPKESVEKLIEHASMLGIDLKGARRTGEFHGGVIPAGRLSSRFVDNGIMIAGDAAKQVASWSSEGLRTSMHAGISAAKTAIEAKRQNNYSSEFLWQYYQEPYRVKYEGNLKTADIVRRIMYRWNNRQQDNFVEFAKIFTPAEITQLIQSNFVSLSLIKSIATHPLKLAKLFA